MKKRIFLKALFFWAISIYPATVYSQDVYDNNRYSTKWKVITTDRFRVIYPETFSAKAKETAALLDTLYTTGSQSISDRPSKKISYVIRNNQSFSNGFVGLGPWRSELFTTPSQDYTFTGTNDWWTKLIIHEYRHVAQYSQANRGLTKAAYWLTGQNSLSAISYALMPQWFWEGDAILMETALTRSGRGRLPGYNRLFKANLMEGKKFNYNKQYLGSYKDAVPNHYVLGNYLVPYVRNNNDTEIWKKITGRTMATPILPFMFSYSMKKETGMGLKDTYDSMMMELGGRWEQEQLDNNAQDYETVIPEENRFYTDHLYPVSVGKDSIVFVKRGLEYIDEIDLFNGEETIKIHVPGILNYPDMWFTNKDFIVWNEHTYHERWRAENYSDIFLYDMKRKQKRRVTRRKFYYGAAMSPDSRYIVTTTTSQDYKHRIVLLYSGNGEEWKRIANPENAFYSHVRYFDEDKLVAVKVSKPGKSLVIIDIGTGEEHDIIPPGKENFGFPIPYQSETGGFIIYSSDVSGTDNIYAIDVQSKNRFKLTHSKNGAYNPSVYKDVLLFNIMTSKGMRVAKVDLSSNWESYTPIAPVIPVFYNHVLEQESDDMMTYTLDTTNYTEGKFRRLFSFINPHSWGPYVDTGLDEAEVGIYSRDVLSTVNLFGGVTFNRLNRNFTTKASASIQTFYPIIDIEYEGLNRSEEFQLSNDKLELDWYEENASVGIRLPFNFTASKYFTNLNLSYNLNFTRVTNFENNLFSGRSGVVFPGTEDESTIFFRGLQDGGDFYYSDFTLLFSNFLKTAHRHVQPRWGQVFILQTNRSLNFNFFNNTPANLEGRLWAVRGILYFPGILRSHSFNIYSAYQYAETTPSENMYWFNNRIPRPRGVSTSYLENFVSAGANYELPVWSPDLSIGPLAYLKRIRLTGFYDIGYGSITNPLFNPYEILYQSVGGEARIDFHLMRFKPEITAGLRAGVGITTFGGLNSYNNFYEIIFPTITF